MLPLFCLCSLAVEGHSLTSADDSAPLLFLSYLPWFEVFYKILNILADYTVKGQVCMHASFP